MTVYLGNDVISQLSVITAFLGNDIISGMIFYLGNDIIPGNDDAIRSINLYANYFKATLSDARELSKNLKKEKIDEEKEKKEK